MGSSRKLLWAGWCVNAALSLFYILAGATVFHRIQVTRDLLEDEKGKLMSKIQFTLLGALAALFLTMFAAVVFNLYSFALMLRRWMPQEMMETIGLGIGLTSAIYTAAFMLLGGVILQFQENLFRSASKSKSDESAFRMAYVLAYMLVASHTMVFVLFIFNKSGLGRNTAQDEGENIQPQSDELNLISS